MQAVRAQPARQGGGWLRAVRGVQRDRLRGLRRGGRRRGGKAPAQSRSDGFSASARFSGRWVSSRATVYWHMAFGRSDPPAAADYVAWLGSWMFLPAFVLLLSLVPLLFPTGAPPGPRWRVVGWTAAVAGGVATLSTAFAPGPLDSADFAWIDNPFGVQGLGLRTLAGASFVAVAVGGAGRAHLGRRPLPPRAGSRAAAAEVAGGGGLRAGRGRGGRLRGDALARRRSRLDRDPAGPAGRGGRHRHRHAALPPLRHRRRRSTARWSTAR